MFFAVILLFSAIFCAAQPVSFSTARSAPAPLRMASEVIVNGNSSRLLSLDVVKVTGSTAPHTYSDGFINFHENFSWFASRHYAIYSDLNDDAVCEALGILELAYPHYAQTFRLRPPESDHCRQALVLASSRDVLENVMIDDALHIKLQGGVTLEGYACAYAYACTPYQTRYILIHEATHVYQYCLSGNTRSCHGFLLEGIADFLSSHVYDPECATLTVNVLDRAPIHNHLANGLGEWNTNGKPSFSTLYAEPKPSRGVSVLLTAFLKHNPDYESKWSRFCERIVRDTIHTNPLDKANAAFGETYGTPESYDAEFAGWMASLKPTYELLSRDFDQEGSALVSAAPASIEKPARIRVNIPDVVGRKIKMSRPASAGAFAGIEYGDLVLTISNTWSHGCYFSLKQGGLSVNQEVPVGFMRNFDGGFIVRLSDNNGMPCGVVEFSPSDDWLKPIDLHLKGKMPNGGSSAVFFASESGVVFDGFESGLKYALDGKCIGSPMYPEQEAPSFGMSLSLWRVIGPFGGIPAGGFPESGISHIRAEDGTKIRWRSVKAHDKGVITPPLVNLAEVFGRQANDCTAFAETTISSVDDKDVTFVLGVSDGVRVLLNGEEAYTFDGRREWASGNVTFKGHLKKGTNTLSLELRHRNSVWLFSGFVADEEKK